jgi:hypothetical protein
MRERAFMFRRIPRVRVGAMVMSLRRPVLKLAVLAAAASISIATAGAANASTPAKSATVTPYTATGCVNQGLFDGPGICLTVNGGGLYVENFVIEVDPGYVVGKFRVAGPTESWYSPVINVRGGRTVELVINNFVPAGNYWGYFEIETSPGKFKQTAGAFVTVHP